METTLEKNLKFSKFFQVSFHTWCVFRPVAQSVLTVSPEKAGLSTVRIVKGVHFKFSAVDESRRWKIRQ